VSGWIGRGAATVAAVMLAAGCAAAPGRGSGVNPGASRPAAVAPASAADNRSSAEREARRLLRLTPVPPGAVAVGALAALPYPAIGIPVADAVVDRTRWWRVGMSADQTLAWMRAHPPAGLTPSGSVTVSGRGSRPLRGYSYGEADSDAWREAQLQVGVTPLGPDASGVRADAILMWLDPRPAGDVAQGDRLRVAVAGGCPRSDRGAAGVSNAGADLDRAMLPAADPTAALVCRYAGVATNRLVAERRLDAAGARRVASVAWQATLSHPVGGVVNCPADDGSAIVVAFAYPGRADVDLWFTPSGCAALSNGHVRADAIGVAAALIDATR
jgi:hypothetical protein